MAGDTGQPEGAHYGSNGRLPLIPGLDGVGRLQDGTRVYFGGPRAPYGTLAEQTVVPRSMCTLPPDGSDDATGAAVPLDQPDDRVADAFTTQVEDGGVQVVIDYLWGHPTEALIAAITRRGLTHSTPRVRLVEVGASAGNGMLRITVDRVPLAEVADAWRRDQHGHRLVLIP